MTGAAGHPLELLSALLDGEISPAEHRELNSHLGGCATCRAILEDLRAVDGALAGEEAPPAPGDLAARILLQAEGREPSPARRPLPAHRAFRLPLAAAAAMAGVLALWVAFIGMEGTRFLEIQPEAGGQMPPENAYVPGDEDAAVSRKGAAGVVAEGGGARSGEGRMPAAPEAEHKPAASAVPAGAKAAAGKPSTEGLREEEPLTQEPTGPPAGRRQDVGRPDGGLPSGVDAGTSPDLPGETDADEAPSREASGPVPSSAAGEGGRGPAESVRPGIAGGILGGRVTSPEAARLIASVPGASRLSLLKGESRISISRDGELTVAAPGSTCSMILPDTGQGESGPVPDATEEILPRVESLFFWAGRIAAGVGENACAPDHARRSARPSKDGRIRKVPAGPTPDWIEECRKGLEQGRRGENRLLLVRPAGSIVVLHPFPEGKDQELSNLSLALVVALRQLAGEIYRADLEAACGALPEDLFH